MPTSTTTRKSRSGGTKPDASKNGSTDYVLPIVGTHLPATLVDAGFWVGLAGAVALGAVDPPLGVLVGAGVVMARHQARR